MRHVSQVLELALQSLFAGVNGDTPYMCCYLDHLELNGVLTGEERDHATAAVNKAINNAVTLGSFLRDTKQMPREISASSDRYPEYAIAFYLKLIAQLRADDPMFLIIESAYHCAHSNDEIHFMIGAAGLPETSDETIANLLGNYADSIKD